MTFTIAVAGKGGVGKSTISALLVRALGEKSGEIVLAVDADPNANLGEKLGVKIDKTIGDLREDLLKRAEEIPAGTSKQEHVRYQIQLAMVEGSSFNLLTMGRPEGPGCYCYINNILRTFLDAVMDDYTYVVIDNEAGMEHLSRRTTRRMDVLLLVSDATKVGVDTALRLTALAKEMELEVGKTVLVINRVAAQLPPAVCEMVRASPLKDAVETAFDPLVEDLVAKGDPLTKLPESSPMFWKVKEIAGSFTCQV